ncbi:MAG: ribonuclease P protein component [Varibaculum sp.]|nr:ribonuclease P protein component [Varibaculum sp.]
MLPRANRLVASSGFDTVLKRGRRAKNRYFILYSLHTTDPKDEQALPEQYVRIGFTVAKRNIRLATDRNRVKRRLRAICREELLKGQVKPGTRIVLRALPAAREASSAQLKAALRGSLERLQTQDRH